MILLDEACFDCASQQPTSNVAKWRTPSQLQWWVLWLQNHNDLKSCGCSGWPCCPVLAPIYPHSTSRSGPNLSRFLVHLRIVDDRIFSSLAKGQLISKGNFGVFNSSKKPTWKFKFLPYPTRAEIFRSFFGRIENTKIFFWKYLTFRNETKFKIPSEIKPPLSVTLC